MARTKEEKERRMLEAKERAERRRSAKASAKAAASADDGNGKAGEGGGGGVERGGRKDANDDGRPTTSVTSNATDNRDDTSINASIPIINLPMDALSNVMRYLPAREYGAMMMTCNHVRRSLIRMDCISMHLSSRLMRRMDKEAVDGNEDHVVAVLGNDVPSIGGVGMRLCAGRREAQEILDRSIKGGGATNRLIAGRTKKTGRGVDVDDDEYHFEGGSGGYDGGNEYPGYVRFVEEATIGHSAVQCTRHGLFPPHLQGRFASCSPEHSLLRLGGGGSSGPGGSGVSSWGVGKRGQLGHGKRDDVELPKLLSGRIGWGVRIVQVSAGGGLVRVAHSLLLTSTGRVLSFGQNTYGQLGHGYDPGNVLSDCLRPRYVDALKNVKCTCVSAGELHSGAVTTDGDVYTWGEGFCGQLGLGDRRPHLLPEQVTLGGLDDECVSNISCGCRHTLIVTDDGEVFSWGLGRFGVLGRSYTDFTYQTDIGMVVPDGEEEGNVRGAAVRPAAVAEAEANQGDGINGLIESLDALNLTLDDPSDQCYPKVIDSLKGFRAVGVSAGHRHSLVLDERGGLFSFGSGASGALGHGDLIGQEFPVKVVEFDKIGVRIHQMSAGVDISMAVTNEGTVYAWGKAADGRLGLGIGNRNITNPMKVEFSDAKFKAVDVECGYVHSLIVGLDGSVWQCGGVGTDGKEDGQQDLHSVQGKLGLPEILLGYNIWHGIPEPKEEVVKQKWEKYGKYELKGRSKMMTDGVRSIT